MKAIILFLTILALSSAFWSQSNLKKSIQKVSDKLHSMDFTRIVDKFGDVILKRQHDESEQVILEETGNQQDGQKVMQAALDTILDVAKLQKKKDQFLQCTKGKQAEFFKVGGVHVGHIGNVSQHESIRLERRPDDCFQTVIVNFTNNKHNAVNSITIEVMAKGRRKEFCTETYIFGTGAKLHVNTFRLRKHHKFTWNNMNEIEYKNVITWGIHIFRLCDTIGHWFPNLIQTAELFVGGLGLNPKIPFFGSRPTKLMQEKSVDFIEAGTGFRWKDREPKTVNMTQDEIKSGDFVAITRFDGIDQIIQYGAGSHSGHSTVALEVDGVMSIVESQDGWYWPKHGIQRNDWETWKKWAHNAGFNVAILPLSEESRAKFDVKKAEKYFKEMEGYPYGYHNFLMGWIDTPKDNYPPVLDADLVLALFSYLERLWEFPINRMLTQALNKRLGTEGRKLSEIAVIMAERNMTFGDLMAVVEKDQWVYSDGPSMVCSSFVANVYKAGGLLNDIQGTEMTPRDVYTLNIFDLNYEVPAKCKKNDPSLPYCQIMGNKLMQMPGYATIEPYPHMAERCPTMTPDFFRPDGC